MDIYAYEDYRACLADWIQGRTGRGGRSSLAQAAQCSPSWMTRALNGEVQLTPDQAYGISQHLELNESEADFFLLLLEKERAATPALKQRIVKKLQKLKWESLALRSSVEADAVISDDYSMSYYSSWVYTAVHVACIDRASSAEEIAARLKVSRQSTAEILMDLRQMGLVTRKGNEWKATGNNMHLPSQRTMANVAHVNWRNRTIQHLQEVRESRLHYSALHCLAPKDVEVIQKKLKDAIMSCRKSIEASSSGSLAVLCVDLYELPG